VKRCPQCDFIYEDDQRLCDMDEAELVHDPRPLPEDPSRLSAKPVIVPPRRSRKSLSIAVIFGCVLLFSGAYIFKRRTVLPKSTTSSSSLIADSQPKPVPPIVAAKPAPASSLSPANTTKQSINTEKVNASHIPDRASPTSPPSRARSRVENKSRPEGTSTQREPRPRKSENSNTKNESRIGSILKKTGRILKKPFKL
jgi:hypothetical protein